MVTPSAPAFDHEPVMLEAALGLLELRPGTVAVDGTLGGGGHAASILERTAPDGTLIGLDVDADALEASASRLASFGARARLVQCSFRHLDRALEELGVESVDAVLLDLGVSSPQLDRPDRGFRFAGDTASTAPLDMRMNPSDGPSAADFLWSASESELAECFATYGELPGSYRLARAIVEAREQAPITRVEDLLEVVRASRIGRGRKHNPATLVFQALRIAVNDELGALRDGLERALEALKPGGRLAVIAYHSLEDRIVKNRLRDASRACTCPPSQPVCSCGGEPALRLLTRRPLKPEPEETEHNPRARSARLRAAERLDAPLRAPLAATPAEGKRRR